MTPDRCPYAPADKYSVDHDYQKGCCRDDR